MLKIEEYIENPRTITDLFYNLAGLRALDLIYPQKNHVINGAEKKYIAVKRESMRATGLYAASNEYYRSDRQNYDDEPLSNLLHNDAVVFNKKAVHGYVIAPLVILTNQIR